MKITSISVQSKNPNRVNVSVDGTYRLSLDVFQVSELRLKVGNDYSEAELLSIETESQFGKLYARALEYCLMRPHSSREVRDYLWRKTRSTKYKGRDGAVKERAGVSSELTNRVYARLEDKGYIDDYRFARFWVDHRNQTKGSSLRKLVSELQSKGVDRTIIDQTLQQSDRSDQDELVKVIAKKQKKYDSKEKLIAYLARQGFRYDDITRALKEQY